MRVKRKISTEGHLSPVLGCACKECQAYWEPGICAHPSCDRPARSFAVHGDGNRHFNGFGESDEEDDDGFTFASTKRGDG